MALTMRARGANHYMGKKRPKLTFDFLKDLPSKIKQSDEELGKREDLQAEIDSMKLYGLTSEAEIEAIRERIRGRCRWHPMSGARRGTGGVLA